jgi:ACS family hexuronate transporter-like MFS transporter
MRMTKVRWLMLSLLFLGTTLNYLDRIVFSFLAHDIRADIHFDNEMYGRITSAFGFAYMAGYLVAGKFMDRVGTRTGYAVAMAWWSIAAALHAIAHSAFSLAFWRAMLGLGESGNFPAAIKSVAEWFPKRERAFATGIFNAGTNVASMFGPFLIAFLTIQYGWRACFIITASVGFLLMIVWLLLYRTPDAHKGVNKAELEYIHSDAPDEDNEPKLSWKTAATLKQTWGFAIAKFLTDPVWWFYLWWLPLYLADVHKLSIDQIRWPILVVYGIADVGSVLFGWVPGFLNRRGWEMGRSRKTAMAICAALMPISSLAVFADNVWLAVALVSVATACHQGWSANLFTTTSDVFPKRVVGSVVGIGGCVGGLGSALFASLVPGIIIQRFGYTPAFLAMGCFHLTALLVVHKLMGGLKPITLAPANPVQQA